MTPYLSPLARGIDYSPQHTKDPAVATDLWQAPARAFTVWDGRTLYHMGYVKNIGGICLNLALLILSFRFIRKSLSSPIKNGEILVTACVLSLKIRPADEYRALYDQFVDYLAATQDPSSEHMVCPYGITDHIRHDCAKHLLDTNQLSPRTAARIYPSQNNDRLSADALKLIAEMLCHRTASEVDLVTFGMNTQGLIDLLPYLFQEPYHSRLSNEIINEYIEFTFTTLDTELNTTKGELKISFLDQDEISGSKEENYYLKYYLLLLIQRCSYTANRPITLNRGLPNTLSGISEADYDKIIEKVRTTRGIALYQSLLDEALAFNKS